MKLTHIDSFYLEKDLKKLFNIVLDLKNYFHSSHLNISDHKLLSNLLKLLEIQHSDISSLRNSNFKKFWVKDDQLREKIKKAYPSLDFENSLRLSVYINEFKEILKEKMPEQIIRTEYQFKNKNNFKFCMNLLDTLGREINQLKESSLDKKFQKKILRMIRKSYLSNLNNSILLEQDKEAFNLLKEAIKDKIFFYFDTIAEKNETI